jgi:hypothetical protein
LPVSDLTITYTHNVPWSVECPETPSAIALTDDKGEFHFEQGTEFMWVLPIGDTLYGFRLCARQAGRDELLWRHMQMGGPPKTPVEVTCDIDQPVQQMYWGEGRCQVRWPNGP